MKIYDISQEVFSCSVYPGDPAPKRERLCSMEQGSLYNLTAFSMCAHNGTHVDAPFHFLKDGKTVEQIPTEQVVGYAFVSTHEGEISSEDAARILGESGFAFTFVGEGSMVIAQTPAADAQIGKENAAITLYLGDELKESEGESPQAETTLKERLYRIRRRV
jgi:kynurenine formamidase